MLCRIVNGNDGNVRQNSLQTRVNPVIVVLSRNRSL
jgi:hypothetical protein